MDNFAFELELLLKQPNPDEAPYTPAPPSIDPASPAIVDPHSAPPIVETGDGYPFEAIGGGGAAVMAAIHRSPPYFGEHFVFPVEGERGFMCASMADPFAPPSAAQCGLSSKCSSADLPAAGGAVPTESAFFASNMVAPVDFVGLEAAMPALALQDLHPLQELFYRYRPAYLKPGGCGGAEDGCLEPNWEAIEWYLAGQVRPGPDVARIYKCGICEMEFPNAQAYGGHMSSHSKTKKGETKKPVAARKAKQFKKTSRKPAKLARPRPPSPWVPSPTNKLEAADSLDEEKPKKKIARTSK